MHEHIVFSHGGTNFASDFPSRQACRNAVNHVFEKQIHNLLKIDQDLRFDTKNNGTIRNDIEENVLFYRLVRAMDPSLVISENEEKEPDLI